jgi:pimeloyl-ACP methyl ester carboxylesterase
MTQETLTDHVTSADGTTIGLRTLGSGPGLVVLHGAMSSGAHHTQLAAALADAYTVYLVDRRGRGLSATTGSSHALAREIEDLDAVLTRTGAKYVFGVSSGAIVALEAALQLPAIKRLAAFEPPLLLDRAQAAAWLARLDAQLEAGDPAGALVTGMKGGKMGPALFDYVPSGLLARLLRLALKSEAKQSNGEYLTMRELAPTLHDDFNVVVAASGPADRFAGVTPQTLLLGGRKSPKYLREVLALLDGILPHRTKVELPGADHAASWNADRRGNPAPVAAAVRAYFGATP